MEGNGLLMYGQKIIVPRALQEKTLQKLHAGHWDQNLHPWYGGLVLQDVSQSSSTVVQNVLGMLVNPKSHSSRHFYLTLSKRGSRSFTHMTSSPYFPSSNGQAENTVQTVKNILFLHTELPWCGRSPVKLLMLIQQNTVDITIIHTFRNGKLYYD